MMKKTLFCLIALLCTAGGIQAQKGIPSGMRMEITTSERDNAQYSLFTYRDDDSTFGYYLGLGRTSGEFAIGSGKTSFTIADVRETCLWLGATADDAFAMLDTILSLYGTEAGTTMEFASRATGGAERLADRTVTTCVVEKKLLGGKRLLFTFASGKRQRAVHLDKSVVKELRFGLKTDLKLHPKQHR